MEPGICASEITGGLLLYLNWAGMSKYLLTINPI